MLGPDRAHDAPRRTRRRSRSRGVAGERWEDNDLVVATQLGRQVMPRNYNQTLERLVQQAPGSYTLASSSAVWESHVRQLSGNGVNRIEITEHEAVKLSSSRRPLWRTTRREGIALLGRPLTELGTAAHA